MEQLTVNASSAAHLNYTAHTLGAVDCWKDAEIITPAQRAAILEVGALVQVASDGLQARLAAAEAAENATSRARARLVARDVVLDMRVMAAGDGVLNGPAQRSRSSEVYRDVFLGGTAGDVTEAPVREEPGLADRVRERLAAAPDFPGKAGLLADLSEAVTRSAEASLALTTAESAEAKAGDAEMAARLELRRALEQAYGKLRAAFPGQRDFVESFFPKKSSRSKKATQKPAEG